MFPAATALIARLAPSLLTFLAALAVAGCVTRAVDVKPVAANPGDFITWGCNRIFDELDSVQQRAAEVAYAVDERAGKNIMALGIGVTVFWPAILAMRPDGLEADDLARLKGRYEALEVAANRKQCPQPGVALRAALAAELPVAEGERLVYEVRQRSRGPLTQSILQITELRRTEFEFRESPSPSVAATEHGSGIAGGTAHSYKPDAARTAADDPWLQDRAGNLLSAPSGEFVWPRLLRSTLVLGQVTAGDLLVVGDPSARARLRGQVVALGPQTVAGRRFDVAVLELFGDAQHGDVYTRVEGALVIDRVSGVLLRLDLRSANPSFQVQRRLVRVEPKP